MMRRRSGTDDWMGQWYVGMLHRGSNCPLVLAINYSMLNVLSCKALLVKRRYLRNDIVTFHFHS